MSTLNNRVTGSLLALSLCLVATPALAGDMSILVGTGLRFDAGSGDVNGIGVVHLDYEVVSMLRVAGEVHGYLGGAGVDGLDFADAQLGVLFDLPIPGWFGIEAGVYLGAQSLLKARHGEDRVIGMLKPELALKAEIGVFEARLSYQHNLLPIGDTREVDLRDGQLTAAAGFTF